MVGGPGKDETNLPMVVPQDVRIEGARFEGGFSLRDLFDPGRSTPIFSNEIIDILIPFGWGMKEIKVRYNADITPKDLSEQETEVRNQMEQYFRDSIDVFHPEEDGAALPSGPWMARSLRAAALIGVSAVAAVLLSVLWLSILFHASWLMLLAVALAAAIVLTCGLGALLVGRLKTDGIWPGLMEERLRRMTERRFPRADVEIRQLINTFADVFLDNNLCYVSIKRLLQALAIAAFFVGAAPAVLFLQLNAKIETHPVTTTLVGIWLLLIPTVGYASFQYFNAHVFQNKYHQSLQRSAESVSRVIMVRLAAIERLFQYYCNSIDQIQAEGEAVAGGRDLTGMHDQELQHHRGFYCMQVLIWLAKRMEYIENHLMYRMHAAQTMHAVISIGSFVSTIGIAIIGIAPALTIAWVPGVGAHPSTFLDYVHSGTMFSLKLALAVLITLGTVLVSYQSYFNAKWNSGRRILRDNFASQGLDGWMTFKKLQFDLALAGRMQRALARIKFYADKVGPR